MTPAPSITTAAFWALSNASNAAYYPQVPLCAFDFKWNEEPAPWKDVYGAWHSEDLLIAFIFGNFTMNLEAFGWSEANKPGRLALSNVMQQSIAAFIRTGDPNNPALGVTWDRRSDFRLAFLEADVCRWLTPFKTRKPGSPLRLLCSHRTPIDAVQSASTGLLKSLPAARVADGSISANLLSNPDSRKPSSDSRRGQAAHRDQTT